MRTILGFFCSLSILSAAPVPKVNNAPDGERILGSWVCVAANNYGRVNEESVGIIYRIEKDRVVLQYKDGKTATAKITLDESGKPKNYRWQASWGTWVGIYELDGNSFKYASVNVGKDRPTEVKPGNDCEYYEFRRIIEKK